MHPIIKHNLSEIVKLCDNHKVARLYVFGSVCRQDFNNESDIDFLVYFDEMDFGDYTDNYFQLCDKLEQLLNRKVDLVTDKSLSNPYFIKTLEKTKTEIYARRGKETVA